MTVTVHVTQEHWRAASLARQAKESAITSCVIHQALRPHIRVPFHVGYQFLMIDGQQGIRLTNAVQQIIFLFGREGRNPNYPLRPFTFQIDLPEEMTK